jgi:ribonuclease HI
VNPNAVGEEREDASLLLIWTDGACEPNPGVGGWGWHRSDGVSDCGGVPETTNNRMELTAILEAMKALPDGAHAILHSDSQYCVNGLTIWSAKWARKDWMKNRQPMPNRELWLDLEEQKRRVQVEFRWVRGHSGDAGNERADRLADDGRRFVLAAVRLMG